LLGQHNELVLNKPETLIKEIENESFYRNQYLYKFVKDYGKTVQREIGELQEIAKQKK
jgi:hypothetical protein